MSHAPGACCRNSGRGRALQSRCAREGGSFEHQEANTLKAECQVADTEVDLCPWFREPPLSTSPLRIRPLPASSPLSHHGRCFAAASCSSSSFWECRFSRPRQLPHAPLHCRPYPASSTLRLSRQACPFVSQTLSLSCLALSLGSLLMLFQPFASRLAVFRVS